MDTKLIAKILSTKRGEHGGNRTIGTGYPIGKDLVLTARHVVVFPERDRSKPITVEWPDFDHKDDNAEIVFEGEADCDIAILKCRIPPQALASSWLLSQRIPLAHEKWEGYGYPSIGKNTDRDKIREKIPVMGKFFPPNATSHKISLTSESDAIEKSGWCGISGAPVFQGHVLYAVITSTPKTREECFTAVSIPYLLVNVPTFRETIGYTENNHRQFFLDECCNYLESINKSQLFLLLAAYLIGKSSQPSAEALLSSIQMAVERDPVIALEQLRLNAEPVMKHDRDSVEQARILLCLVLGLIAVDGREDNCGVHNLDVRTRMMVEISLAAHYRVRPDFEHDKSANLSTRGSVVGRYAIDGECLREVGWDAKDNAQEIAKVVNVAVNKVYEKVHGSKPNQDLDDFELDTLNETLRTRRLGESPQLIRFEVEFRDKIRAHPLHDDAVCAALRSSSCLPDLPVVRYGSGTANKEAQLRAQVNEFFRIIEIYSK